MPVPGPRPARAAGRAPRPPNYFAPRRVPSFLTGDCMKLYGFWRSLATYRVKVALALKGLAAEEVSIDLLKGRQHDKDYVAVNPQAVVPALVLDDGGPPLFQSLAILEYLEETKPQPALLPKAPRGRARIRGIALIGVADGHPLVTPRIRGYMEKILGIDEKKRNDWLPAASPKALEAIESHLKNEKETGRYCHGDSVTLADICMGGQVIAATAYFKADVAGVP